MSSYADNVASMPIIHLPCGGTARFDDSSGISYRCEYCMAVVGSIGMPGTCKDEQAKWDNWKNLGGKGWDWLTGESEK